MTIMVYVQHPDNLDYIAFLGFFQFEKVPKRDAIIQIFDETIHSLVDFQVSTVMYHVAEKNKDGKYIDIRPPAPQLIVYPQSQLSIDSIRSAFPLDSLHEVRS